MTWNVGSYVEKIRLLLYFDFLLPSTTKFLLKLSRETQEESIEYFNK